MRHRSVFSCRASPEVSHASVHIPMQKEERKSGDGLSTATRDRFHFGRPAIRSSLGRSLRSTPNSRSACQSEAAFRSSDWTCRDEEKAEPVGGANEDEPVSSVSIAPSVAAHPRRSPRSFGGEQRGGELNRSQR